MSSKNWKFLFIAALATSLVACGKQQTESSSSGGSSAYAGVWIRQKALQDYKSTNSVKAFCARAKANRSVHGLASGVGLPYYVSAITIENNGDVRRFEQVPDPRTAPQGYVSYNGQYQGGAHLNNLLSTKANFVLSSNQMTVAQVGAYGNTGVSKLMVRTDRDTVNAYIEKMKKCIFGQQTETIDSDWVNGGYDWDQDEGHWYKPGPKVGDDQLDLDESDDTDVDTHS